MPDSTSPGAGSAGPTKKPVSTARNIIGLVVLIAVAALGWLEYSAKSAYNTAVTALDKGTQDETKGFLPIKEAENLLKKEPDDAGTDVQEGNQTFTKKTYSWRGLLKSYTLTAFYTKQPEPHLHHYETEGAKFTPEAKTVGPAPNVAAPPPSKEAKTTKVKPSEEAGKAAAGTAPAGKEEAAPKTKPKDE